MGIFIKSGIFFHTLKFHLHTLSCHFWLNLCTASMFTNAVDWWSTLGSSAVLVRAEVVWSTQLQCGHDMEIGCSTHSLWSRFCSHSATMHVCWSQFSICLLQLLSVPTLKHMWRCLYIKILALNQIISFVSQNSEKLVEGDKVWCVFVSS